MNVAKFTTCCIGSYIDVAVTPIVSSGSAKGLFEPEGHWSHTPLMANERLRGSVA